jgi:hypothetical protein
LNRRFLVGRRPLNRRRDDHDDVLDERLDHAGDLRRVRVQGLQILQPRRRDVRAALGEAVLDRVDAEPRRLRAGGARAEMPGHVRAEPVRLFDHGSTSGAHVRVDLDHRRALSDPEADDLACLVRRPDDEVAQVRPLRPVQERTGEQCRADCLDGVDAPLEIEIDLRRIGSRRSRRRDAGREKEQLNASFEMGRSERKVSHSAGADATILRG